ncbi:YrhK family protein [Acidimangrovimonas sediminis]|uniref:YrhK family protein n=1 Tax=Acidimangrovimonas sediminis TaxID=2056283 RepID=UPI000C7F9878|nr:YrhK family protein [Acidimangrovimonas sediminis]
MKLFHPNNRYQSEDHARLWAFYEVIYTFVDFSAAAMFFVGSILFFWKSTETAAIWLFIVGSAFFGLKPTIRLWREVRMARLGKLQTLAERLNG